MGRVDLNKADGYKGSFWYTNADQWSNLFGRRAACKDQGLSGKALRDCKKGLRQDDKGLSFAEKRERAIDRKMGFPDDMSNGEAGVPSGLPDGDGKSPQYTQEQIDMQNRMAADMSRTESRKRTGMYIAIGAGSLLLIGLLIWFFKFRGKKAAA